jgi:hypothetical protein
LGFSRQPVLKPELEQQLKEDLHPLWLNGMSAPKIAKVLQFGISGTKYEKLKKYHVWFYRSKFRFHKRHRGIPKGKSRYKKKIEETMTFQTFQKTLNNRVPPTPFPYTQRKRTYLILHFWTPLRKSEIYERQRQDFEIKGNTLRINLYRKKKYYRPNEKKEPFFLPLKLPLLNEVIEWLNHFEPEERPWNFSSTTAWNYVKEVFGDYYPHFFRFDYITKAVENAQDPKTLIIELLMDTGLDLATISAYIMSNPKHRTSINERELESLTKTGININKK